MKTPGKVTQISNLPVSAKIIASRDDLLGARTALSARFFGAVSDSRTKLSALLWLLLGRVGLYRRFSTCWTSFVVGRLADCKSAIQQIANLRYDLGLATLGVFLLCGQLTAQTANSAGASTRFVAVDLFVDSQDRPLAAYQLEFSVTNNVAQIVGIEGGEHTAFAEPPYYDPKAMQRERVIIAAFSTEPADKLPAGRTRVATVHLQVSENAEPEFSLKLHTAADADGRKITVSARLEERRNP